MKCGALSAATGYVKLDWHVSGEDSKLVIDWKETNGPPVEPPRRTGFGTEMIEQAISCELGATSQLHFLPDGVHCRLELPLDRILGNVSPRDSGAGRVGLVLTAAARLAADFL